MASALKFGPKVTVTHHRWRGKVKRHDKDGRMALLIGAVAAAIITAVAATTAAWISRSIRISEFRQKWIDELRSDISSYVGVAEKWFRKWDEIGVLSGDEKETREHDELFPIANEARVIVRRIRLRFNPEANPSKDEDEEFLKNLVDLINPGTLLPEKILWDSMADRAVQNARRILKREWEVTKRIQIPRPSDFYFRRKD